MTGTKLGPFALLEKLGEGGMGVVYKAKDTRLDRFVAIKLLPESLAADPGRRARFIQEARAASALNHPNIVTIHEIAEENGVDFIVMEYITGRTLDQAIPRKGMRVSEVLGIATQMAAALTAAHEAKIIHRDLKPGNVMVTDRGVVKLLDFGLAKLRDAAPPAEDENTRTFRPQTEEGSILGTVSYMSPEQAEGKTVDSRSDIFSFGTVLYEMLTGQRAFQGESRMSTISRILEHDPKPVHELVPEVPVELERIVNRCLRKDPRKRFQGAADLEITLQELKEESDSGRLSGPAGVIAAAPAARKLPLAWISAGALALALGGGFAWYKSSAVTPSAPKASAALTQLTFDSGLTVEPSYWPGGNMIAYASDRANGSNLDIWIQQLGGEAKRLTTHAADDREPSFSPDGSKIAFRSERDGGGIYVVSTLGGTERKLVSDGRDPRFSPDGQWIAYWIGQPGIFRGGYGPARSFVIPANGGPPKELGYGGGPVWVSNGTILNQCFLSVEKLNDVCVVGFPNGTPRKTGVFGVLLKNKLRFGYGAMHWTGRDLILTAGPFASGQLWRIPLSTETFQATGEAHRLSTGATIDSFPAIHGKRLIYGGALQNDDVWSLPLEPDSATVRGEPARLTQELSSEVGSSISADGKRIAYMSLRNDKAQVIVRDLANKAEVTVHAFEEPNGLYAGISPDGQRVAWFDGQGKSFLAAADGSGGATGIEGPPGNFRNWAGPRRLIWTLRGETFLFEPDTKRSWLAARTNPASPHGSPDGRWAAGYEIGDGKSWIVVYLLGEEGSPTEKKDIIKVTDGSSIDATPDFSPDGNRLYFVSHRDGFQCLWTIRLDPKTKRPLGEPKEVYHFHSAQRSPSYVMFGRRMLSVAKDKVVFNMAQRTGNIWMTELPE